MTISYPNKHSWFKKTLPDSLQHYGKNDQRKIKKTLAVQNDANITTAIHAPNQTFFDWFIPMYNQTISTKENALVYDIRGTTVDKLDSKYQYQALTVYEDNQPVGGCIFSVRPTKLSIAYRIFNRSWKQKNIAASPAIFGEYILDEYAFTQGKKHVVHGIDRNPYGVNSAIGLCIFKLAVGCRCKIPSTPFEVTSVSLDEITQDQLILHMPKNGKRITDATLLVEPANEHKYEQLFKYPERLQVQTIHRIS